MKFYSHLLIFSLFLVSLVSVGQDLIPFENRGTGLWGFRNQETGDVVIEPKFDEVEEFAHSQVCTDHYPFAAKEQNFHRVDFQNFLTNPFMFPP